MALTALQVERAKKTGKIADGKNGLYLVVDAKGAKRWIVRLQVNGRRREFGAGSAAKLTLAQARARAAELAEQFKAGVDPVAARKRKAAAGMTFEQAARKVHEELAPSWKNKKHAAQWLTTLEKFAFPKIGSTPVADVDSAAVREVLLPIWLSLPETARRVRQRIGTVLDWAHSAGIREHEAPRSVTKGLPKQKQTEDHFAALPWQEIPDFIQALRMFHRASPVIRLAIEWTILTACRSGEVRGATWGEIDREKAVWVISASRMKAGRLHTVPLSSRCLQILAEAEKLSGAKSDAIIFPGTRGQLSDMSLTMALRRMELPATIHGMRSSFRVWCSEAAGVPNEVAEAALAHVDRNKVRAAYLRSDHLEARREVMERWAAHVCNEPLPTAESKAA